MSETIRDLVAALPDASEVDALRRKQGFQKGPSRLEQQKTEDKLTLVDERAFKKAVRLRDKHHCRMCGRKVVYVVERVPNRGEVHHIHGRAGDLRYEVRAALVLCCECHEKVTGRVNIRIVIIATKTFSTRQGTFTDARFPVQFQRAA